MLKKNKKVPKKAKVLSLKDLKLQMGGNRVTCNEALVKGETATNRMQE